MWPGREEAVRMSTDAPEVSIAVAIRRPGNPPTRHGAQDGRVSLTSSTDTSWGIRVPAILIAIASATRAFSKNHGAQRGKRSAAQRRTGAAATLEGPLRTSCAAAAGLTRMLTCQPAMLGVATSVAITYW